MFKKFLISLTILVCLSSRVLAQNYGPTIYHIDSMQDLEKLTTASMSQYKTIVLSGYYSGNPTGGGIFTWLTAAQASGLTPDGGVIIAPSDNPGSCSAGCLALSSAVPVTPFQYGAKCDGVTDDSTALQKFLTGFATLNYYNWQSSGNCVFGTALSVSIATTMIPLKTLRFVGDGVWKFTGTGTSAITMLNTGNNANGAILDFQNFSLDISGSSVTYGLDLQNFDLSRWYNLSVQANNNICIRMENTLFWSENNTFDKVRCSSFKRIFQFDRSGTGTDSFARTTIQNLFGAEGSAADYWIYISSPNISLYDSVIRNIDGNEISNATASFIYAQGAMTGTVIDGIKVEASGGSTGYVVYNAGFTGSQRGPRVLDWPGSFGGFGGGVTNAQFADSDTLWDYWVYPHLVTPKVSVQSILGTLGAGSEPSTTAGTGSAIQFSQISLSGTTAVPLTGLTGGKGAYLITVTSTANDAPSAVFSVSSSSNAGNGNVQVQTLSSAAGYSTGETLALTWPSGSNYPQLAKSGAGYDGMYNIVVIGN